MIEVAIVSISAHRAALTVEGWLATAAVQVELEECTVDLTATL